MAPKVELTLHAGPLLEAKHFDTATNQIADKDVSKTAMEFLYCPVKLEGVTLRDVVKLIQSNLEVLSVVDSTKADYIRKCTANAEMVPNAGRKRFKAEPGTSLVLSSSLGFDAATRETDAAHVFYMHAEYQEDEFTMATHSLLGLHVQDCLGLPIRYEATVELLERDFGKLAYEHCVGKIQRARPLLIEVLVGVFQEFVHDESKMLDSKTEDQGVVFTPEMSEAVVHCDIALMFQAPFPIRSMHRSLLNAVFFYIGDHESLESGLARTHPGVDFTLSPDFKTKTGYETRRNLLGDD